MEYFLETPSPPSPFLLLNILYSEEINFLLIFLYSFMGDGGGDGECMTLFFLSIMY